MNRIFVTLAVLGNLSLAAAFWLGLSVGDASLRDAGVQQSMGWHLLAGLGAVVFSVLVHSIVLTYFMGTSRWLEETTQAYHLGSVWIDECRTLKYRTLPAMALCLGALIATAAFGAAADPASPVGFKGWWGVSPDTLHLSAALCTWGLNLIVNLGEYAALSRNGEIVNEVLGEVRRIRRERGLET